MVNTIKTNKCTFQTQIDSLSICLFVNVLWFNSFIALLLRARGGLQPFCIELPEDLFIVFFMFGCRYGAGQYKIQTQVFSVKRLLRPEVDIYARREGINIDRGPQQTLNPWLNVIITHSKFISSPLISIVSTVIPILSPSFSLLY